MKNKLLLFLLCFFTIGVHAQWQKNGNHLYSKNTGNIGVDIITPLEKLHVNGSVRGNQSGALRISTGNGYIDIGPKNGTYSHFYTDRSAFYFDKPTLFNGHIGSFGSSNLLLQTNNMTRLTIANSNGFVAIGDILPSEMLDVAGTIRIRSLPEGNDLSRVLVVDQNGKVHWRASSSFDEQEGDNLGNHIVTTTLRPEINNQIDLGSHALKFSNLYLGGTIFSENIPEHLNADNVLVYENGQISWSNYEKMVKRILDNGLYGHDGMGDHIAYQSIIPTVGSAYDLGSPSQAFRNLYLNNAARLAGLFENEAAERVVTIDMQGNLSWQSRESFKTFDGLGDHFARQSLKPITHNTFDLGFEGGAFRDLYLSGTTYGVHANFSGDINLPALKENNALDRVVVSDENGKLNWREISSMCSFDYIVPSLPYTFDIGNSTSPYRDLYLGGKILLNNKQFVRSDGYAGFFLGENAGLVNSATSKPFYGNHCGNHFIGYEAGFNNTSGYANHFFGYRTGYRNTTGTANLFLGHSAGYNNDNGNQNLFIGVAAGHFNTSGSNNYFIGLNSGLNNTTGSSNHFFGWGAGYNNITGNDNVSLGAYSLFNSVSGNNNVCVGTRAGTSAEFNDCVFIGNNSGSNINLVNAAAIGSNAQVYNDNGFVLGNSSNRIGIHQNAPLYPLHVANAYCDGNTWFNASDKDLKENFRALTNESILDKVMELQIEKWNYIGEKGASHIGPTAQDFNKVFNLGGNDKVIASVDEAGVALAAIQELNKKTKALEQLVNEQQLIISTLLQGKIDAHDTKLVTSRIQLNQNAPNPFSKETKITMSISDEVRSAILYIYDINGKTLEKHPISERGDTSIVIEGGKLPSGIYLYALIADGQASDIKRMILTK